MDTPSDLFPYPPAPHLAWLGTDKTRATVLAPGAARALLARPVVVEEKPDGATIGIAFPDGITPRVQQRATVLSAGAHAQFQPLWGWLAGHQDALAYRLGRELVLFGEWCFALHTVKHDRLPDWFLACDVYDRKAARFWTAERRNALVHELGLARVPEVLHNKVDLASLTKLLDSASSALGSGSPAGFAVRLEAGDHLVERAVLVRAEVARAHGEPSTKKTLERNALEQV